MCKNLCFNIDNCLLTTKWHAYSYSFICNSCEHFNVRRGSFPYIFAEFGNFDNSTWVEIVMFKNRFIFTNSRRVITLFEQISRTSEIDIFVPQ